jgi:hypothetical protein
MAFITREAWAWFIVCTLAVIARTASHMIQRKTWKFVPPEDLVMFVTYVSARYEQS